MTTELTLWKDRDPAAMRLPGIYHGALDGPPDNPVYAVAQLASEGVQFVRVPDPVDLTDPDGASAVAVLLLVRELTSHGIAVDWTLRMADPAQWQALSHLHPPAAVLRGATGEEIDAGVVTAWRGSFHIAKCGYRRGPGFLEIRDHRWGSFRRLVVNAPAARLSRGCWTACRRWRRRRRSGFWSVTCARTWSIAPGVTCGGRRTGYDAGRSARRSRRNLSTHCSVSSSA